MNQDVQDPTAINLGDGWQCSICGSTSSLKGEIDHHFAEVHDVSPSEIMHKRGDNANPETDESESDNQNETEAMTETNSNSETGESGRKTIQEQIKDGDPLPVVRAAKNRFEDFSYLNCSKTGWNTYSVVSLGGDEVSAYQIDLHDLSCSCEAGDFGKMCKHITYAIIESDPRRLGGSEAAAQEMQRAAGNMKVESDRIKAKVEELEQRISSAGAEIASQSDGEGSPEQSNPNPSEQTETESNPSHDSGDGSLSPRGMELRVADYIEENYDVSVPEDAVEHYEYQGSSGVNVDHYGQDLLPEHIKRAFGGELESGNDGETKESDKGFVYVSVRESAFNGGVLDE